MSIIIYHIIYVINKIVLLYLKIVLDLIHRFEFIKHLFSSVGIFIATYSLSHEKS